MESRRYLPAAVTFVFLFLVLCACGTKEPAYGTFRVSFSEDDPGTVFNEVYYADIAGDRLTVVCREGDGFRKMVYEDIAEVHISISEDAPVFDLYPISENGEKTGRAERMGQILEVSRIGQELFVHSDVSGDKATSGEMDASINSPETWRLIIADTGNLKDPVN